ncbi:flagellar hook assembly protein FlgD [bacterium]|nr:flagellar hook assembly protein FlgD [bacterium]
MTSIDGGNSMKIKTEWASRPGAPAAPEQKSAPTRNNVGDKLNQLTGVTTVKDPFAETTKKKLDKDAFLKMFMTQLKYQDPTSPVDNEKMAQQMAMFTQIEQSVTTNQYLEKMLARTDDRSQIAYSMIGKTVSADRASLFHDKLSATEFDFDLPKDASTVKVQILDEAGELVKELDLESHTEGKVAVRWDGATADGQPAMSGRYFYAIKANDKEGNAINIDTKLEGRVSGITKSGGDTFLLVGDRKVNMNEVTTVKETLEQGEQAAQLNSATKDRKPAGTNPVSNSDVGKVDDAAAKKAEPKVNISDEVAKALRSEDSIEGNRLNPMMPIFMR